MSIEELQKGVTIDESLKQDMVSKLGMIARANRAPFASDEIGRNMKTLGFSCEDWYMACEGLISAENSISQWDELKGKDRNDAFTHLSLFISSNYEASKSLLEQKDSVRRTKLLNELRRKIQDEELIDEPLQLMTIQAYLKKAGFLIDDYVGLFKKGKINRQLITEEWKSLPVQSTNSEEALHQLEEIAKPDKRYEQGLEEIIARYNEKFLILSLGGRTVIVEKDKFPYGEIRDFKNFLQMYSYDVANISKVETIKAAEYWFNHPDANRKTGGLIFDPTGTSDSNPDVFNLWKGYSFQPENNGKAKLYLDFISDVICSGNEQHFGYVMAHMADIIQHPTRKNGKAIALRGKQGTGKTFFVEKFGKIFGDAFYKCNRAQDLTSRFNKQLANKIIIFNDENFSFWAGDDGRAAKSFIKNLITSDTIDIEFKGKDSITLKNYARLFLATNEDWVAPVEKNDRRYVVFDVADIHQNDHEYFKAIEDSLNEGGYSDLLYYLQNLDISSVDFDKDAPLTAAKLDNLWETQDPLTRWMKEYAISNFEEVVFEVSCDSLFEYVRDDMGIRGSKVNFGKDLKKHFPNGFHRQRKRIRGEGKTFEYFYTVKIAGLKRDLEQLVGFPIDWAEECNHIEQE